MADSNADANSTEDVYASILTEINNVKTEDVDEFLVSVAEIEPTALVVALEGAGTGTGNE
eukprot:CAMPEP_0203681776 /NCGR_PEP_ID=MMETSP0090-20130426/43707_1 /ASSEMBLY_ACC=CAM_ASM_001088 /TAXON_ID=426623 /ORGANISM="Chaetoceros affinis, Strain CCMP159" /LENGTH=59 /DNA_ID=CAMNT_0050550393 /DNA_START=26 /DNA_END=202 /DNA_ORIENTATION=+